MNITNFIQAVLKNELVYAEAWAKRAPSVTFKSS